MIEIIFSIILLIAVYCGILYGIHCEKQNFNNGFCPKCGKPLKHFDTDSQGGRGYWRSDCRYFVWVSYDSVDKKYKSYGKN